MQNKLKVLNKYTGATQRQLNRIPAAGSKKIPNTLLRDAKSA